MKLSSFPVALILRLTALLCALWLIFGAPAIGPLLREKGWEAVPLEVPAVIVLMLVCGFAARHRRR